MSQIEVIVTGPEAKKTHQHYSILLGSLVSNTNSNRPELFQMAQLI